MDAKRALAILNRAAENQMYDPERIPEDDGAKIQAATEQVQLAEQMEQVVHRMYANDGGLPSDAIIAQKVPHWPAICAVLAEAKVFVGANEPESPPDGPLGPDDVVQVEKAEAPDLMANLKKSLDDAKERHDDPVPAVEAPAADQAPDQGDPVNGEVWLDQRGNAWEVVHYSGGSSAEVKSVASGEPTIVPAGFLKRRQEIITQGDKTEVVLESPMTDDDRSAPDSSDDEQLVKEIVSASDEIIQKAATVRPGELADKTSPPEQDQVGTEQDRYEALVEEVQERYQPSGMPIPQDLADPPSIDAESFADVDDATARILHGKYNALAARAKYLHDVEDAVARRCDLVRMHHMRRAMAVARKSAGKDATVTEIKILAEEDELVVEWAEYVRQHIEEAKAYKTFHDIYAQHVVVLSRDWSMREMQVR